MQKAGTQGAKPPDFRPSELERETGFEPATLSLGTPFTYIQTNVKASQALVNLGKPRWARVQPSLAKQVSFDFFATPVLREKVTVGDLPEGMMTVREVARLLRVSRATVYRLCARRDLDHVRVLNVIRIPSEAVGALPEAGRSRP